MSGDIKEYIEELIFDELNADDYKQSYDYGEYKVSVIYRKQIKKDG